jgi:MFS family permease
MRADLGWTYADAGSMNTANAIGYLAGALAASSLAGRLGVKLAFLASLLVTPVVVAIAGLTSNFGVLLAVRFTAGVVGAIAFVAGGSLAAAAAKDNSPAHAPIFLGLYFAGGGAGIVLSALAVPPLIGIAGKAAGLLLGRWAGWLAFWPCRL